MPFLLANYAREIKRKSSHTIWCFFFGSSKIDTNQSPIWKPISFLEIFTKTRGTSVCFHERVFCCTLKCRPMAYLIICLNRYVIDTLRQGVWLQVLQMTVVGTLMQNCPSNIAETRFCETASTKRSSWTAYRLNQLRIPRAIDISR